jgi:excisionase family DNA binding protein
MPHMECTLTLEDVCALLKISVQTGRNRLCNGALMPPSFRTGRRRLFLASAVDAWILQQAGAGQTSSVGVEPPRRGRPRNEDSPPT